jgi:hypothetical protein
MATIQIKKATRKQLKLRMALDGPSGSGKTYTALRFAFTLASSPDKVGVIDTENRSASKFIGEHPDGFPWEFSVVELDSFHPQYYIDSIAAFEAAGTEVLVIDSLSHAWDGVDGLLELHDKATRSSRSGNSWTAWRDVTPFHNRLIQAILRSKMHIIATMRSKMDYVQEKDEKGNTQIKKVGMAPIQRAGMEYEYDIVCDMDWGHNLLVSKSRCNPIDGKMEFKPGPSFMVPVKAWLDEGVNEDTGELSGGEGAGWRADPLAQEAIRQKIKALALVKDDWSAALGGVAKIGDFPGSLEALLQALEDFALDKAAKNPGVSNGMVNSKAA